MNSLTCLIKFSICTISIMEAPKTIKILFNDNFVSDYDEIELKSYCEHSDFIKCFFEFNASEDNYMNIKIDSKVINSYTLEERNMVFQFALLGLTKKLILCDLRMCDAKMLFGVIWILDFLCPVNQNIDKCNHSNAIQDKISTLLIYQQDNSYWTSMLFDTMSVYSFDKLQKNIIRYYNDGWLKNKDEHIKIPDIFSK